MTARARGVRPSGRRGSASVEFALLLPVAVSILTITSDVGWYLWRHAGVLEAAREGSRVGADVVDSATSAGAATELDITEAARTHALAVLQAQGLECGAGCEVTATWDTDVTSGYELLTTRVQYPYHPFVGVWAGLEGPVSAEFTVMTATQL